jgi:Fe-S cluster assembly iron-binding protein IscA
MLASIVGGLTTRTAVADRDEHFDSNRFKIVDDDFVLTTLNKSVINFTDRVVEIQKAVKELNK